MLGAICGDVIGSVFEHRNFKNFDFPLLSARSRFTDDTVLTVAVADAILNGRDYGTTLKCYGKRFPNAGYGSSFRRWLVSELNEPYNSWGNGSAMRVSPVGWAFGSVEEVLDEARRSAEVTHNHPEGVKGAQAVALAIFLARQGETKEGIGREIETRFAYDLGRSLGSIRPNYAFDVSCMGSVPEAIISFLESSDFESAVRNAVSLGGDSDTIACMAGAIAEAHYGDIPENVIDFTLTKLPKDFMDTIKLFQDRFSITKNAG